MTKKQRLLVEALALNPTLSDAEVCRKFDVTCASVCRWRQMPEFAEALKKRQEEVWSEYGDKCRKFMFDLASNGDYRAIEFILKTTGLNPTQKVDASISGDINLIIDDNDQFNFEE